MATAKQIAWRKKFAEMARSGKLAKTRKNPAPKKDIDPDGSLARRVGGFYYSLRDDGVKKDRAKAETVAKFPEYPPRFLSAAITATEKRFRSGFLQPRAKKNPAPKKAVQTKRGGCNPEYLVQVKKGNRWVTVGGHGSQDAASAAAETLNNSGLKLPIRVWG